MVVPDRLREQFFRPFAPFGLPSGRSNDRNESIPNLTKPPKKLSVKVFAPLFSKRGRGPGAAPRSSSADDEIPPAALRRERNSLSKISKISDPSEEGGGGELREADAVAIFFKVLVEDKGLGNFLGGELYDPVMIGVREIFFGN